MRLSHKIVEDIKNITFVHEIFFVIVVS